MSEERWEQFENLISSPSPEFPWLRVVAVGECGLDYSYKNSVPKATQIYVFTKQLQIAMKYKILLLSRTVNGGLLMLDSI